jgi:hypothetical protein
MSPLHTHAPYPCSFSLRILFQPANSTSPCYRRCVTTPPSTAHRFFHPTASQSEPVSRLRFLSTRPRFFLSQAGPLLVSEPNISPLSTYHRKTSKPYLRPPTPTSLVSLNQYKRIYQNLSLSSACPALPERSETSARRSLGSSIEVQSKSYTVPPRYRQKCWTRDRPEIVVKVAPRRAAN